jgi:hypothetical protein
LVAKNKNDPRHTNFSCQLQNHEWTYELTNFHSFIVGSS